ncbi:MAG TPA: PAAR-like domain-containing protein [Gammaproteobacteria bacterium]|nr:PAAR-like domain-containing protein [Gammaproteobacteria bacterium]
MPTVFANSRGVVAKADSGISMAFPDVCHMPSPPPGSGPGVPIPYPNIAATAQKKQASIKTQKSVAVKGSSLSTSRGDEAGTMKGMMSSSTAGPASASFAVKSEIGLIKSNLNTLHSRLQGLPARDPNEWQALLQEYLVLASALYLAQSGD